MEEVGAAEGTGAFKCPRCGATTTSELDNCPDCGQFLTIKCPECESIWRYIHTYSYCPSCGTKVTTK